MRRCHATLFRLCLLAMVAMATAAHAERPRYEQTASPDKLFADVMLDLEYSIGRHNFAVVGHNEIGDAVRRRGHPAFPDTAIVHFCNLEYARKVIDVEPSLILYMPCRIAVFDAGGAVHAASLLLPVDTDYPRFNALAVEINATLREIIDYAVADNAASDTPQN